MAIDQRLKTGLLVRLAPIALRLFGIAAVALFFVPWLAVPAPFEGWSAGVSGWRLAIDEGGMRSLLLVPASALILIACGTTTRILGVAAAVAGGVMAGVTAWVFVRPMFPTDTGFTVAVIGAILAIAGSFFEQRALRLIAGLAMGLSFLLPWLGQSGADLVHPPYPCMPATIIPYGVVAGALLSIASAIAPRRVARYFAWLSAGFAVATVIVFGVVHSIIGFAAWGTMIVGLCALAIASLGMARERPTSASSPSELHRAVAVTRP